MASNMYWQQWIREELNVVFEGNGNVEDWDHEKAFPKLKRCLALMVSLSYAIETLRTDISVSTRRYEFMVQYLQFQSISRTQPR